jgi:hypothetical protein
MSKQVPIKERHEFGRGIIQELAKYLYKSPKSAFKEAVSNALDQMPKDNARVEIYPDMAKPLMVGSPSGEIGIGTLSDLKGDAADRCIEQQGIIDTTKTAELIIGKPLGCGKGHKRELEKVWLE